MKLKNCKQMWVERERAERWRAIPSEHDVVEAMDSFRTNDLPAAIEFMSCVRDFDTADAVVRYVRFDIADDALFPEGMLLEFGSINEPRTALSDLVLLSTKLETLDRAARARLNSFFTHACAFLQLFSHTS